MPYVCGVTAYRKKRDDVTANGYEASASASAEAERFAAK